MSIKSVLAATILVGAATSGHAAEFVTNGSLENGNFVPTIQNYMPLSAGATDITGWTVSPGTISQIVWAQTPTGDSRSAADGLMFVDLSGFGNNSTNGAIQQTLLTIPTHQYTFSFDFSNSLSSVSIGSLTLSLALGSSFVVGSTSWTHASATFVAPSGSQLLKIANITPDSQVIFIDAISVVGDDIAATPIPGALPLFASGLGVIGFAAHRRKRKALAA